MHKYIKWNVLWVDIIFLLHENAIVGYSTTYNFGSKQEICHTLSGAIILDKNPIETSAEKVL